MDGISAFETISTLVGLIKQAVKLIKDLKDASEDRKLIADELDANRLLLETLGSFKSGELDRLPNVSRLLGKDGALNTFKGKIEELLAQVQIAHGIKDLSKRVKFVLQSTDIRQTLETLEHYKSIFLGCMVGDSLHIILDKLSVSLDEPEQQALAPIFVNSVFSHDLKSFVARPHYADALEKGFSISKQMLLYGLGGVGKSQIAISYAQKLHLADSTLSIVWVHTSTRSTFIESYKKIALQIPATFRRKHREFFQRASGVEDSGYTDEEILTLVRDWFCSPAAGKWLMIVDNADDLNLFTRAQDQNEPLKPALPKSEDGTMLITSRDRRVASSLIGDDPDCVIHVKEMCPEDAMALFRTVLPGDPSTEEEVLELAGKLDYLPLAIKQATSFIAKSVSYPTISSYSRLFDNTKHQTILLGKDFHDPTRPDDLRNSVVLTWEISFEKIKDERAVAADMLSFIGVLSREGIPTFLLAFVQPDELELDDDVSILSQYSLVEPDTKHEFLSIHRLVQVTINIWLTKSGKQAAWQASALEAIKNAFLNAMSNTDGKKRDMATCRALHTHAQVVSQYNLQSEASKQARRELALSLEEFDKLGLSWLHSENVTRIHERLRASRSAGMGMWLFEHSKFLAWSRAETGTLWLTGKPGSGKTSISSFVVDNLQAVPDRRRKVVYFYFTYKAESNAATLLQELLLQLCLGEEPLPEPVDDLHARYESTTQLPTIQELIEVFCSVINLLKYDVFVIIDALDECSKLSRRDIQMAIMLLQGANLSKFHLFVSSRPRPEIESSLRLDDAYHIHLQEENACDIGLYIQSRLKDKIQTLPPDRLAEIQEMLEYRSRGMFVWAKIVLDILLNTSQTDDAEKFMDRVREIPDGLMGLYDMEVCRIPPSHQEVAGTIFMWLLYAKRPLSLAELLDAIRMPENSSREWDYIRRATGALVELSGDVVQFSHSTVRDYLRHSTNQFISFHLVPESSSLHITSRCLDCLLSCTADEITPQTLADFPLLRYAAEYWHQHLKACSDKNLSDRGLLEQCARLFDARSPQSFLNWLRIYDPANPPRGLRLNARLGDFATQERYIRLCGIPLDVDETRAAE